MHAEGRRFDPAWLHHLVYFKTLQLFNNLVKVKSNHKEICGKYNISIYVNSYIWVYCIYKIKFCSSKIYRYKLILETTSNFNGLFEVI